MSEKTEPRCSAPDSSNASLRDDESVSQDSGAVAAAILDEVLDNVVNRTQWDIATLGMALGKRKTQLPGRYTPGICHDIGAIVTSHAPNLVLNMYTCASSCVEVLQMKCVEQQASGYCGHYALHFALCMCEVFGSRETEEVLGYLGETSSLGSFWRRYWLSVKQLHQRARNEDAWPWTVAHINKGDMERSFLRHLLQTDAHVTSHLLQTDSHVTSHLLQTDAHVTTHGGQDNIIVITYQFGVIQNSFASICRIQQRLTDFCTNPDHTHLIFILGVTNHWVTMVAYKTASNACCCHDNRQQDNKATKSGCGRPECGQRKIGIVYLDSNNVTSISYSDSEIDRHVIEQEKRYQERKGRGYPNWKRQVIVQAYMDQRELVKILTNCISGCGNLIKGVAEDYIKCLLSSFESNVKTKLETDQDMYLPLLMEWTYSCFPPKVLSETLLPFLDHCEILSPDLVSELSQWALTNLVHLQDLSPPPGLDNIQSFTNLLEKLCNSLYT